MVGGPCPLGCGDCCGRLVLFQVGKCKDCPKIVMNVLLVASAVVGFSELEPFFTSQKTLIVRRKEAGRQE